MTECAADALRSRRSAIAAVVVAFSLVTAAPGQADTIGRLNAIVAGGPIPDRLTIAVSARYPSERTALLQPLIEASLRERGYMVDPQGPWQLQFAVSVESVPQDRTIFRLLGRIGSDSRADLGVEVPLPQWPLSTSPDTAFRYNVWMTLGEGGRPAVWQGSATAVRPDRGALATDRALATALLARLGETVADQPLPPP